MIKRAILIAAGRGKRLGTHTDEIPKSPSGKILRRILRDRN